MRRAANILEEIGIEKERLGMFFMSGSQAQAFAAAAHTMTERVRKLGPSPLKKDDLSRKTDAADREADEEVSFRGRAMIAGD
jgi:hypothetical protein